MLKVSVFDLEGPLSPADHAALACKDVGEKIGFNEFEKLFEMLSTYDDYLVENPSVQKELKIGDYNPGDTLRLVAPFLAYYLSDSDLVEISNNVEVDRGDMVSRVPIIRFHLARVESKMKKDPDHLDPSAC